MLLLLLPMKSGGGGLYAISLYYHRLRCLLKHSREDDNDYADKYQLYYTSRHRHQWLTICQLFLSHCCSLQSFIIHFFLFGLPPPAKKPITHLESRLTCFINSHFLLPMFMFSASLSSSIVHAYGTDDDGVAYLVVCMHLQKQHTN